MDSEAIRARVAGRIRELAARRDLPLNRLVERSGVGRTSFYAILRGERAATTDMLTKLAVALGVDPHELLRPPRKPRSPRSS